MQNLAIIGASYLQLPLIEKAKEMGYTTHVFAWAANDVGETAADFFYPVSIVEKELILEKCSEIGISGICSIASDLAMVTVNYVATELGLTGNSPECTYVSTNKHAMRKAFAANGDPSPRSYRVESANDLQGIELTYPVIVKPLDRSGSRGITKLTSPVGLDAAIQRAKEQGFLKFALVEEFAEGTEYSVECISWEGKHTFLAMTRKYTTGSPHFVETGHIQPAQIEPSILEKVKCVVFHALDSLEITYGASHTEVKISADGEIRIIEIGARMGGDLIGSSLVQLSTGTDFVKAVIDVAVGVQPKCSSQSLGAAAVRFVFDQHDVDVWNRLKAEHPEYLVMDDVTMPEERAVTDSASRFGCFLMRAESVQQLLPYLPEDKGD